MAKAHTTWTVLAHDPIEKLSENLWRVEGALPAGMPLRRVMTVAKRSDGLLVVHSAISLDERSMKELDDFGKVGFIIVPNGMHRLDAPTWKQRYPDAKVLTAEGSVAKVSEVVAVSGTTKDYPKDAAVQYEPLAGVKQGEGVMIVRSADGVTVVLNDAVFNMPKKPSQPLGWLITTLFGSAPGPRVSRLGKLMMVDNKGAFRADLERLAETPGLTRLIVSHGALASGDAAKAALLAAASGI